MVDSNGAEECLTLSNENNGQAVKSAATRRLLYVIVLELTKRCFPDAYGDEHAGIGSSINRIWNTVQTELRLLGWHDRPRKYMSRRI